MLPPLLLLLPLLAVVMWSALLLCQHWEQRVKLLNWLLLLLLLHRPRGRARGRPG
jgi:hypothetical protein